MKKVNINDFALFLESNDWTQETDWETHTEENGVFSGVAWVTSTSGDVEISYSEYFSFEKDKEESLSTTEADDFLTIEGAVIVDDDGNKVPKSEWYAEVGSYFKDIDYSKIIKS